MSTINIAFNISPLKDGNSVRGVGYYTQMLSQALKQVAPKKPDFKNYQFDLITDKTQLTQKKYDLIHYPYFNPFQITLPGKTDIPLIVTIHDLIPVEHRPHFPPGLKGSLNWILQKRNLKYVDFIITPSHYSKFTIHQHTKYPLDHIYVTYEAADSGFKPISDKLLLSKIKNKYNLPDKFVLFVGDLNWNKNIPNLVKSCLDLNYPLVIVGSAATKKDVPVHPETKDIIWLQNTVKGLKDPSSIILTGYVPDIDLPVIFNLATIYCQPSFSEGFGLPVIQAMQSGIPVAISNSSCLPEISDDNAISFDPTSAKDISSVLQQLWTDPKLRQKYSKLGLKRSKYFDWQFTALQTLSVYQMALSI